MEAQGKTHFLACSPTYMYTYTPGRVIWPQRVRELFPHLELSDGWPFPGLLFQDEGKWLLL